MRPVNYYRDTGGWGLCLLIRQGPKWTRLLDVGRAQFYRLRTNGLNLKPELGDVLAVRCANILAERLRALKREPTLELARIISELRTEGFSSVASENSSDVEDPAEAD